MTYEEAIKGLKNIIEYWTYHEHEKEVAELAISALEKQIPKKPDLDGGVYCPCCLHEFKSHYDETRYCPNCGQAIDWSDVE